MATCPAKKQEGFTFVELAFYVALLSVVLSVLVSMSLTGTQALIEHDTVTRLQERNRVALFRVVRDFRAAIATTVVVSGAEKTLDFTIALDFDGAVIRPGDSLSYRIRPRADSNDGAGELVRLNQTKGESVVICSGLDLADSTFELNGSGVNIRLTNVGRLQDGTSQARVSGSVSAFPRN